VSAFLATFVVGLGTYATRALFIIALAKRRIPDPVLVALEYVAPAAMAALIVALLTDGSGQVAIGVPEVSALAVGALTTYKTRNHVLTLIIGMTVYWVVRALV
jgi:branched-subunit amino acid transport protein